MLKKKKKKMENYMNLKIRFFFNLMIITIVGDKYAKP